MERKYNELVNVGNGLLDQGKAEAALEIFQQAAALAPTSSNAHANVGVCHLRLSQTDEALVAFAESEKFNPRQVLAVLKLAQLLDNAGRTKEAKRYFARLMEVDPSDPRSYFKLAHWADQAGDSRKASQLYGQCVDRFHARLKRDTVDTAQRAHFLEMLARCQAKVGRVEEALASYDEAIAAGDTQALISKADELGNHDRMLEAATMYEKVRPAFEQGLSKPKWCENGVCLQ